MIAAARDWLNSLAGYATAHERACLSPRQTQLELLQTMLAENKDTIFGVGHHFNKLIDYADYKCAVPVREYSDLAPWMDKVLLGEVNVLTKDTIIGFEQTSGSSGGGKIIPYTESLRRQMAVAIGGWMHRWASEKPLVFDGRSYWSISPPELEPSRTDGGMVIGMDHDGAYFPEECAQHFPGLLVLPARQDGEGFFDATVRALVACDDLASVSVWSPSFFLRLDQLVRENIDGFTTWKEQWPGLNLLSCWTDAQSVFWIEDVMVALGDVEIESKGLMSTEGIFSVPEVSSDDRIAAVGSHFLEFMNEEGECVLCDEVIEGAAYEIVITTAGGLYRYRTRDMVRISRVDANGLPRFLFVGRSGRGSDLVGEKITEEGVIAAMTECGVQGILMVAVRGYILLVEKEVAVDGFESQLCRNPYYAQALRLGQLDPIHVRILGEGAFSKMIGRVADESGARIGDVKLPALMLSHEAKRWMADPEGGAHGNS